MRMCVPAVYGGPEADPMTVVEVIEAVSRDDGAAGWCTMIASTTSSMALFLPPETAKELFGDPAAVAGGVFAPNGIGTADGDGVPRVRPVAVGEWHAALPVDRRRDELRRRHLPPLLLRRR